MCVFSDDILQNGSRRPCFPPPPNGRAVLHLAFSFDFVSIGLVLWFEFKALRHGTEEHFAIKVSCYYYPTTRSMQSIRIYLIFTQSL